MSAEQTVPTLDPEHALRPSLLAPEPQRQLVFWLALAIAAVLHAVLVVGITLSRPHYLGDPGGDAGAINVEIVDAGELRAIGSADTPPAAPTTSAAQAAKPAPEPTPEPESEAEPAPKPATEAAPQPSPTVPALATAEPEAATPPDAAPEPKTSKPSEKSDSAKTESAKQESEAKPKPKELKPPTHLDLSVPFDLTMQGSSGAGASSATRPAGITRSGENDRFGRGVISALKKTMPPSEGITGKVTVRIFLNERGNIAKLDLVQGSGDRGLDDSVLFSVQQASIPFPPKGATVADRTFLVTYIYR